MPSFRDLKVAARRVLHERMSLAAFYFADGLTDSDPLPITVRVHTKIAPEGDIKGTSFDYAEREAEKPRLVFLRAEVEPKRRAVVTIENGEGYRLDSLEPPDLITTSANVTRLSKAEVEDYDFPPGSPP